MLDAADVRLQPATTMMMTSSSPLRPEVAQQPIQFVQLPPWPCRVPARCFRGSHIVYMLALCICFQTFFFLAYHNGSSGDASVPSEQYDEALQAMSPGAGGELVTYPPVPNLTAMRRKWRREAGKFLRAYEAVCAAGWPAQNQSTWGNQTGATFSFYPVRPRNVTAPRPIANPFVAGMSVNMTSQLPLCPCVPSGLSKFGVVVCD